jgi:polyhydroxyalkanoate synthesis regulator phasin
MTELTPEAIEEKIKKVEDDLKLLRTTGDASRKTEVLNEYIEYLKDELRDLKSASRPQT